MIERKQTLQIGILGFGTVGSEVAALIQGRAAELKQRVGRSVLLRTIVTRQRLKASARRGLSARLFSTNPSDVTDDPNVDVVVELIGGVRDAKRHILRALAHGKDIVTANKALLAAEVETILEAAAAAQRAVRFEASVGGGIPIVRAMYDGLMANRIESIQAIVNGTSNYVLTAMADESLEFRAAVAQAQACGYAERNPSLDVNGMDAAHKLVLLVLLGFGQRVHVDQMTVEGIRHIAAADLQYADQLGYQVKPLAMVVRRGQRLDVRVHPALLSHDHPLAAVHGVNNAILVHGDLVGETLFAGRGAGARPTASAVLSDVVELARRSPEARAADVRYEQQMPRAKPRLFPIDQLRSRYYLRCQANDRPGVLARIASILGRHQISLSTVLQMERAESSVVPVVMLTHEAREASLRAALQQIDRLQAVHGPSTVLRIEGNEHG